MHLGKILKIAVSSCIYKIISHYFALEMTKNITIKQVEEFLLEKKENSLIAFKSERRGIQDILALVKE